MLMDVDDFSRRLRLLQTEVEIASRARQTEATKARKALDSIQEHDIEMLSAIVPELPRVYRFTTEEILQNAHGEVDAIVGVVTTLREYLDKRLSYYEEQL